MTPSDEDLLAFLDGRLDADAHRAVATALDADGALRTRLQFMETSGAALQTVPAPAASGLDDVERWVRAQVAPADARHARPVRSAPASTAAAMRMRRSFTWGPAVAASLLLVTFGGVVGYVLGGGGAIKLPARSASTDGSVTSARAPAPAVEPTLPTWMVRVVDYHTLYARDTLTGVAADQSTRIQLEDRLSRKLARSVHIPDLAARALTFHRGQLLRFQDVPVAQLAYLPDGHGTPVALCLRPTTLKDMDPVLVQFRGMNVVRWRADGLSFVIVGHRDGPTLLADAMAAHTKIRAARDI
ncbi:MAG: hypothetical protein AAFZ01_09665 [Pseudomonadota bacterium]